VTCGALRLARFNVQIHVIDKRLFNGLPIPAAALVVAATVILFHHLGMEGQFNHILVLVAVLSLAMLMVSSIKFYSFKDMDYFLRKPFISFVLIILILTIVIAEPQITIFTFSVGYSLSGPVWFIYRVVRRQGSPFLQQETKVIEDKAKS
jgi:CDP-diacylglycerol--serine O-phosphatidyltransferase